MDDTILDLARAFEQYLLEDHLSHGHVVIDPVVAKAIKTEIGWQPESWSGFFDIVSDVGNEDLYDRIAATARAARIEAARH